MRNIKTARIKEGDLKAIGNTGIQSEFHKLPYEGNYGRDKDGWYVLGKKEIALFIKNINIEIDICAETFKDAESMADYESDRRFLASLL